MFIDKELQFADGTWAPTATGDNISTNVLDTSPLGGVPTANGGRDLGQGENLWLVITVKTAVTSGGAATVDFRLRTDSAASLVSAPVDLVSSGAIAKATLVAGYQVKLKLPSATYKKYIGVNANIGTAVLTAGAFEAEIVKDLQANTKYAGGFNLDS
jgi:hypothetical protein